MGGDGLDTRHDLLAALRIAFRELHGKAFGRRVVEQQVEGDDGREPNAVRVADDIFGLRAEQNSQDVGRFVYARSVALDGPPEEMQPDLRVVEEVRLDTFTGATAHVECLERGGGGERQVQQAVNDIYFCTITVCLGVVCFGSRRWRGGDLELGEAFLEAGVAPDNVGACH